MSEIFSDIIGLEEQVERFKSSEGRVNTIYDQFNSLKNSIDNVICERHNINYQLDTASKEIKSLGERLASSGVHINSAINSYLDAERRLQNLVVGLEIPEQEQEQSYRLNIQPTEQWIKGEQVPNRNVTRRDTCWTYGLGEEESLDINNQLLKLDNILNNKKDILKSFRAMFEIEYLILVIIKSEDDIRPIMSIKTPIIELMHSIGAELDIDMYIY